MSGFHVPISSSPDPTTPDKTSRNGSNQFSFGATNPSTTPAGPPPSSARSFTPAGLPPSSVFGSSIFDGTGQVKPLSFSQQTPIKFNSPKSSMPQSFMRQSPISHHSGLSSKYKSSQRSFQDSRDDPYGNDESDNEHDSGGRYGDSYEDGYSDTAPDEDGQYEHDEDMNNFDPGATTAEPKSSRQTFDRSTDLLISQAGLKQGKDDSILDLEGSLGQSFRDHQKASTYGRIAKDMYGQMGIPPVQESDDLVLSTESIIASLYEGVGGADTDDLLHLALTRIPRELVKLWTEYDRKTAAHNSEEYAAVIGPGPKASGFARANFLAGLVLQIHHPQEGNVRRQGYSTKPLPQIMLEWMDEHHDPYPSQFEEIQAYRPSPANHRLFWDSILNGLLRGKVVAVVNLLKNAGWRHARTGLDDIRDKPGQVGFTGLALTNVEKVIGAAIQVLQQCPAVHGDWDIRGSDWTLFRLRISQALEDLKRFAEGRDRDPNQSILSERDEFGISSKASHSGSYSRIAKRAESQVPWHIYQNLLTLYSLVSGDSSAIIENSQDWCEATIGLLVWWDEGKHDRRLALGRSQGPYRVPSRDPDSEAYLRKLRRSFDSAIAESTDFQVNTLDPIEVGLASVLEGDAESVVGILRAWSGPISSAVAEVASLGGWLPHAEPRNLISLGNLDEDDMDVLGIHSSPGKVDGVKDQTLIAYAQSLSKRGQLKSKLVSGYSVVKEGWELAIGVLGRLDSAPRSEEMVGDFLNGFPLDSSTTVDKLWRLLNNLCMSHHAESTAETYADHLADHSHKYGEALWYYALSHKTKKVKDVLDLLISMCLIHSTAYPPESELDEHLKSLISSPKRTLSDISRMDFEAAELLHKMLSGYATLRRFYSLRDTEILQSKGGKPRTGTIARKIEAAVALLTVITSSDDNIRGGLYDEGREAVVSVDFLLALLGEAMVFVNQPNFTLTVSQIATLTRAIEDLETVGPRVRSDVQEFFLAVLASVPGLKGSSPTDMLRKSISNVSGTSSFSLVGSSMIASQLQRSIGSSGILVKGNIKRGWDWRQGLSAGTTGESVLRILRLGLAKDLARAWLLETDKNV